MSKEMATGKFRRIHEGRPFAAIVTISVERPSREPGVRLDLCGSGFRSQGDMESAPPQGPYEDWREAAVRGAAFALRLASAVDACVTITAIEGRAFTDTTAATVAAAAVDAVCQALGVTPPEEVQRRLTALVLQSWSAPERVPDLEAEL